MIVWGVWLGESFWFSTGAASRKARNLLVNPQCVIGTRDAAAAAIIEGMAEPIEAWDAGVAGFVKAYRRKYRVNLQDTGQPVYRFRPSVGFGLWEKKFERTATRWRFR